MKTVRVKQIGTYAFEDSQGRAQEIAIYETEGGGIAAVDSSFVEQEVVEESVDIGTLVRLEKEGLMPVAWSPYDRDTLMVGAEGEV